MNMDEAGYLPVPALPAPDLVAKYSKIELPNTFMMLPKNQDSELEEAAAAGWTWDYYRWTIKDERALEKKTSELLKNWARNPWNKTTSLEKRTSKSQWSRILAQNEPPAYSDQFRRNTQRYRISLASSSTHHKVHRIPLMQKGGAVAYVFQKTIELLQKVSKHNKYDPPLIVDLPAEIQAPDRKITFSCATALKDRLCKNDEYIQKIQDVLIKAPFFYQEHNTNRRMYTKAQSALKHFLVVSKA